MQNVYIIENDTDVDTTDKGLTTAARSIQCVVYGTETDHDIAVIIARIKGYGVPTIGTISVPIVRSNGTSRIINFTKAVAIPITVTATLTIFEGFDFDSVTQIKLTIIAYIDGLSLGEHVDLNRIVGAIYSVPNHRMDMHSAVKKEGSVVINTEKSINRNQIYTLIADDIILTLERV